VLKAGAAAAALATAGAGGVALAVRPRELPLTLAALLPLVGTRFAADGVDLRLSAVTGLRAAAARDDAFRVVLTSGTPVDLPGGTRTFTHDAGALLLHTEPVGADGTAFEAVVVRSA
jgi:hypothetical protein